MNPLAAYGIGNTDTLAAIGDDDLRAVVYAIVEDGEFEHAEDGTGDIEIRRGGKLLAWRAHSCWYVVGCFSYHLSDEFNPVDDHFTAIAATEKWVAIDREPRTSALCKALTGQDGEPYLEGITPSDIVEWANMPAQQRCLALVTAAARINGW